MATCLPLPSTLVIRCRILGTWLMLLLPLDFPNFQLLFEPIYIITAFYHGTLLISPACIELGSPSLLCSLYFSLAFQIFQPFCY